MQFAKEKVRPASRRKTPASISAPVAISRRLRVPRWMLWGFLGLVIVAIGVRAALPVVVEKFVNKKLNQGGEYVGRVGDVDISLWRGAYTIERIQILKANGAVADPFMSADSVDLSIEWKQLFRGAIVGEVQIDRPQVNYVSGSTKENSQTGADKDWRKVLEDLSPVRINRFVINQGSVRFRDPESKPPVDIFLYDLFAQATNLTNVRNISNALPAAVDAYAQAWGKGRMELHLQLNPLAALPTFKLEASLTNVDLVALNDFMRAYAKVDVESGTFSVFTEIAAADGRYEGYVKPFFENLQVFSWEKDKRKNVVKVFWEALVGGVTTLFENQPKEQLATKVPLSGSFQGTQIDVWATVGNLLRNAFIRALVPKFDRSVRVEDVVEGKER